MIAAVVLLPVTEETSSIDGRSRTGTRKRWAEFDPFAAVPMAEDTSAAWLSYEGRVVTCSWGPDKRVTIGGTAIAIRRVGLRRTAGGDVPWTWALECGP